MKTILYIDPFLTTYHTDTKEHVESIARKAHGLLGNRGELHFKVLKPSQGRCEYPDLTGVSGILSLGSFAHVSENREWYKPLKSYILSALEQQVPVLGICFTHQLMGAHYGLQLGKLRDRQGHLRQLGWNHRRDILITHPKFRFLLWQPSQENLALQQECLHITQEWSMERCETLFSMEETKLSPRERRVVNAVEQNCPMTMRTHARHYEELYSSSRCDELVTVGTSAYCTVDALMHKTLPLVAVQSHPERPVHTDGSLLIRNFLTQALY